MHEAGSVAMHSFDFNPIGGRELFFYYGGHLGSGVGTSAGVKLARPNQQVICLVGDGSFIFGPTALWNMARLRAAGDHRGLQQPRLWRARTAASSPTCRAAAWCRPANSCTTIWAIPTWTWPRSPAASASTARWCRTRRSCARRWRAPRQQTVEGKPYLLDVQVARKGVGWAEKPWIPPIQVAGDAAEESLMLRVFQVMASEAR